MDCRWLLVSFRFPIVTCNYPCVICSSALNICTAMCVLWWCCWCGCDSIDTILFGAVISHIIRSRPKHVDNATFGIIHAPRCPSSAMITHDACCDGWAKRMDEIMRSPKSIWQATWTQRDKLVHVHVINDRQDSRSTKNHKEICTANLHTLTHRLVRSVNLSNESFEEFSCLRDRFFCKKMNEMHAPAK